MTDIVDCLEGTSFDHPGRQDVTVYLLYYPCPVSVFHSFWMKIILESRDKSLCRFCYGQ